MSWIDQFLSHIANKFYHFISKVFRLSSAVSHGALVDSEDQFRLFWFEAVKGDRCV